MDGREALIAEALRIYRRYATEVVEGLGLCPWAEHARRAGHVVERVLLLSTPDVQPAMDVVAELAGRPEVEILLVIFPLLELDRRRFEHFVAELREADAKRHELGSIPFVMAAFHPDAEAELSDPERLIPFLRRSPDPTIQLVRRSVLERVRRRAPEGTGFVDLRQLDPRELAAEEPLGLRERIARDNLETVQRMGVARVEELLADIRRDRDRSYARLVAARAG